VLRVPNAALNFRPTTEVFMALGQQPPDVGAAGERARGPGRTGRPGSGIWLLRDGRLERVRVEAGISDGAMTAVAAPDLSEQSAVVTGVAVQAASAAPASNGSPLLPQRPGQNRGTGTRRPTGGG
jgi:hypothetical protein